MVPYGFDNFHRDGAGVMDDQGARPNYPGDVAPLTYAAPPADFSKIYSDYTGSAVNAISTVTSDDFKEARNLYRNIMQPDARERLVNNVASSMRKVRKREQEKVWTKAMAVWKQVDDELAQQILKQLA